MRVMLFYSQIGYSKLTLRNPTPKIETKETTNHQRTERHDIKEIVTKAKLQICYVRIFEIVNEREDIEAQQEISVPYDCVIKLN